ncbi:MAG: NAD-dependent epimerase/dehydratase family protein [Acidimicrobiia bacterium]|nr:NAD-dependent epimerase/dehydratase family protein [Acidimicrobiia bacterium]
MRVVVTGAAGFIGSHLCEALLEDGHEVVGVDCFTDYYPRRFKELNLLNARDQAKFEFIEADLRSDSLEPILSGCDAVVNEAATPGLLLSWDDFDRYQSTNLTAVKRLLDAAIAVGIGHFVQASTSSVYGADATGDEESHCLPVSPYGVTKLAAEHLLRAHSETADLPLTILRYFSIYGPRQRPDMAYRIFCERLLNNEPIVVFGDGLQSRSNTYVSDCVDATIAALHREPDGSVFNIGGGQEVELLHAIDILAGHLGVVPVLEHRPARRGDQRRTCADTTRARKELGWEPTVLPEEGLRAEVSWVRSSLGLD